MVSGTANRGSDILETEGPYSQPGTKRLTLTVLQTVRISLLIGVLACAVLTARSTPAEEAARRFSAQLDAVVSAAALRVFVVDGAPGGLLVTPSYFGVTGVTLTPLANGHSVQLGVTTPKQATTDTNGVSTAARRWEIYSKHCWSYEDNDIAADQCYQVSRFSGLVLNWDAYRRPWALHHFATIKPRENTLLSEASVRSEPEETTATYWADWNPRSDQAGNCGPVTVGLSGAAVPVALSFPRCEKWDITIAPTPGQFENRWDPQGVHVTGERQVAYAVEVFAPDGSVPG